MDKDIIPPPDVQEQPKQEDAFLSYFMLFADDFTLISSVCQPGKLAAIGAFFTVLKQLVICGPDANIDYDSLWSEVEKEARITSARKSEYMKDDFIRLCKGFRKKVVRSSNKRDQQQKKKAGGGAAKKSQKESKRGELGADPEGGGSPGFIPDSPPADVQNTPAIIAKWQEYKPMTYDEAADFIDEIKEEGQLSTFVARFTSSGVKLRDKIITPEYDEFDMIFDCCDKGYWGSIISRDEEKLQLFIWCCLEEYKSNERIDILNLWKSYGGFRMENGSNLLWYYLANNSKEIMNKLQSRYQYNHETRLWYPITS